MTIGTQEHIDLMKSFERYVTSGLAPTRARLDREEKSQWPRGHVYQHADINNLFRTYSAGYALARCVYLQGGPAP